MSTLVFLTATVVLGLVTASRWSSDGIPRFASVAAHRDLSLISIGLLLAHVATTLLDPYAHLGLADAIIPVGASYRPVWLGLGVAGAEVLLAVGVSSVLRGRIGPRPWRVIHWAAYASWPLALLHGMGTGSDARAPWMIAVVASCLTAVLVATVYRLSRGTRATAPIRAAAMLGVGVFLVAGTSWALGGPLMPGWAARAGTPVSAVTNQDPVHRGPGGFQDPLVGVMERDPSGYTQISMRDEVDTALTVSIRSPNSDETLPVVTVARGERVLCDSPATASASLYAVCNRTRLTISLAVSASGDQVTGLLTTSGPLN